METIRSRLSQLGDTTGPCLPCCCGRPGQPPPSSMLAVLLPSLQPPRRCASLLSQRERRPHSLASPEPLEGLTKARWIPRSCSKHRLTGPPHVRRQSVLETEASIPKQVPSCFSRGSLSTLPSSDFITSCRSSPSTRPPSSSPVAQKEFRESQSCPHDPLIQSAVSSVQIKPTLLNPTFKAAHNPAPSSFPSWPTHIRGAASAPVPCHHAPRALAVCCCPSGRECAGLLPLWRVPGRGPAPGSPTFVHTVPYAWRASLHPMDTHLQGPAQMSHCNPPSRMNCSLHLLGRIWKVLSSCLPCGITVLPPTKLRVLPGQAGAGFMPAPRAWSRGSSRCWLK